MPGTAMRVLFVEAAGDMVHSWKNWSGGQVTESETSVTFSSQVFEFVGLQKAHLDAVSFHTPPERLVQEPHTVSTRPRPFAFSGKWYYLGELFNGLWLLSYIVRTRPDVAIVNSGVCMWLPLLLCKYLSTRLVVCLHNTPWPEGFEPTGRMKRLLLRMDGWVFAHAASAVLCVSPACRRQVEAICKPALVHTCEFLPQYHTMPSIAPATYNPLSSEPFSVMFAGRVEEDKGVFDLLEVAQLLAGTYPGRFEWHVCGAGSALAELQRRVSASGLAAYFKVHGRLNRSALLDRYARAHAIVIPTRSSFNEGFAMVAAEAVLMNRPIVSTGVVPACEVLGQAVEWARTDNIPSYVAAFETLAFTPGRYLKRSAACQTLQAQFLNPSLGLSGVLQQVMINH